MPPRFFTSPYKNALPAPGKREAWWSEIPVSTSAPSDSADLIKTTSEYWLAQGASSGSLVYLPYEGAGKLGGKAPTLQTGCRIITSFETSPFDDLLAVGGDNGLINVFDLPPLPSLSAPAENISLSPLLSISCAGGKPIDTLSFHPTSSGLLLTTSAHTQSVYDISSGSSAPAYEVALASQPWSSAWSGDGTLLSSTSKDGKLRLWDVRANCSTAVAETLAHAGPKASRHVHLPSSTSGPQILTTGFSRTRDREYSLFDGRMLGNPIKTQRVDTNTGVMMPLVDESRNIVYMVGRGDMTLRWVEVGGPAVFTEGATPLPVPLAGAALCPPHILDLMKAEINRLVVLSNEVVVPVPINVPRRQYIDFHSDLFPPTSSRAPAQTAVDWRGGKDGIVELTKPDPSKPWSPLRREAAQPAAPSPAPASSAAVPSPAPSAASAPMSAVKEEVSVVSTSPPSQAAPTSAPTPPSAASPVPPSTPANGKSFEPPTASFSSLSLNQPIPAPAPAAPAVLAAQACSMTTAASSAPTAPTASTASTGPAAQRIFPKIGKESFNPGWSRKFLAGKTPLKPDYFDVHDLSVTMSADVQLLKANWMYLFFPLGGPGGRLAVHPVASKGRFPTHIPALVCGASIVNFEIDPFDPTRVLIACDDDTIRIFRLPQVDKAGKGGLEGDFSEPERILKDSKMNKINELRHHPAAQSVLLSVSDDHGSSSARIWNTDTGEILLNAALPPGGISSAAWSPDGSRLAISTKRKQVCVLDPRVPSSLVSSPSHDSIRPIRVTWASDSHLVSTGFDRGSNRELILYTLDATSSSPKLSQAGKQTLDVSPAPLLPFYDLDSHILLLYSRGDRSCLAYEVDVTSKTPFGKLPPFEHSTLQSGFAFLPKTRSDVKAVEIVKALRLTPGTIEAVSFTVPRAKAEFFQDDIFVPTANTEKPSMSAADYASGKNALLEIVDLQPAGMKPLSEAPAPTKTVSTRSKIKDDGLTDSQREAQYMDRLFESAQDEAGDEGEEEQVGRSRVGAPDDDDW
ncbi:hypothetical protein JCM1841_005275 [Sporobolomyces salmonicolor]